MKTIRDILVAAACMAAAGDGNTMDTPGDAGGWNGTLTFGTNVLEVLNGRIMAPTGGD